jgi:hypothetical protein
MNSGIASLGSSRTGHVRAPRAILLLTTIYVLLLVAVGIAMVLIEGQDGLFGFFPLCTAFVPATIYAIAAYRYGHALFGGAEPAQRNSAWSRLLRISAILYSLVFVAFFAIATCSDGIETIDFVDAVNAILVCAITVGLLVLWVYTGEYAFLRDASPKPGAGSRRRLAVGTALLAGGVVILGSLKLDVDYLSAGWKVLLWKGRWVTNEFVFAVPFSLDSWIRWTMFAGYVAGLALALLGMIVGVMELRGRSLSPEKLKKLLNFSLVMLWFTLTSYWGDCLYMSFVGIFNIFPTNMEGARSAVATALWVATFLLGVLLWFRHGNQSNSRGRKVRTILLLWNLPLMALTVATFWYAAVWELYGLILFVTGVQMVAACFWKISSNRSLETGVAFRSE